VPYNDALALQRQTHAAVLSGNAPNSLLLLEHPPVYTLGKRGGRELILLPESDLVARGAEIIQSDRGGLVTFHGPGQLVGYPILDLKSVRLDLTRYVSLLLDAVAATVGKLELDAEVDMARPGVYVHGRKIAAVGVRQSHGVTLHGFALNVSTDLSWYDHIVACGLKGVHATSVEKEGGVPATVPEVATIAAAALAERIGLRLQM